MSAATTRASLLMPLSPISPPDEATAAPTRTVRLPLDPAADARGNRARHRLRSDARRGDAESRARQPALLRQPAGDLPGCRLSADDRALADGLLASAAGEKRNLRRADLQHPRGARARALRAGRPARDQLPAVLLPGVRARQGSADRLARGVPRRALAASARARYDDPRDDRRADTGDARDRPARPRLGHGLHGDRADAAVRRRHLVAAAGGAGGARVSVGGVRARSRPRPRGCTCSSPTRWNG